MKYEYRHERIQARVDGIVYGGPGIIKQQVYREQVVQEALNRLGAVGWELVSMEPEWVYGVKSGTDGAVAPEIIECWYATFKRPREQ